MTATTEQINQIRVSEELQFGRKAWLKMASGETGILDTRIPDLSAYAIIRAGNAVNSWDLINKQTLDAAIAGLSEVNVSTVNSVSPVSGNIALDADNIPESATRFWLISAQITNWNDAYNKRHEHSNSANLDLIGASSGRLQYNSIDYAKLSELHEHSNKAVLDAVTASYTTTEETKLSGIAENANLYVHPASHDANMINQSSAYRFVTDTEKNTWNSMIPLSQKGANSGVAELDSSGLIITSQLPSYVDDVAEYDDLASFPATGESGKIYIAIDTNMTYRWSGSTYVNIASSLALGETSATAYRGDRGKTAYDHSQSAHFSGSYDDLSDVPSTFAPSTHTHDDRYYTETETDTLLTGYSATSHTHDDRYYTESEIDIRNIVYVADTRDDGDVLPSAFGTKSMTLSFTDEIAGSVNSYDSVITVKGWSGDYTAWQLMSCASTSGSGDLYFRNGAGSSWNAIRKVAMVDYCDATYSALSHNHSATEITSGNLSASRLPTSGTWTLTDILNITGANVGIGTASPSSYHIHADDLVIYSTTDAGITIASNPANYGVIYFADGTTGDERYRGLLAYDHTTDKMFLGTSGATKMTIDSSGNIDIISGSKYKINGTDLSYSDVGASATSHTHSEITTKGSYVWTATDDPRDFPTGISCSFVTGGDGWQNYGSVLNVRGYGNPQDGSVFQLWSPYSTSSSYNYGRAQYRIGLHNNAGWSSWKTIADIDYCDSTYATVSHNHDTTYSALSHNHDTTYSALSHNHDTTYSALSHNHSATDITSDNLSIDRMPTYGSWDLAGNITFETNLFTIYYSLSRCGVGTATPSRKFDILDTNPQLRLTFSHDSHYVDFEAGATGFLKTYGNGTLMSTLTTSYLSIPGTINLGSILTTAGDRIINFYAEGNGSDLNAYIKRSSGENGELKIEQTGTGNLVLGRSGSDRLVITNSGLVGINCTPAYGMLDIRATAGSTTGGITLYTGSGSTARSWIDSSDNWIMARGSSLTAGIVISAGGAVTIANLSGYSATSHTHTSITNDLTVDAGTNTTLTVLCDDSGQSEIRAIGDGQGTGIVYVGQTSAYGGGIFYNGDGTPAYATGEASDRISYFRRTAGVNHVVFDHSHATSVVDFKSTPTVNSTAVSLSGHTHDSRYYTESETDQILSFYARTSHTHQYLYYDTSIVAQTYVSGLETNRIRSMNSEFRIYHSNDDMVLYAIEDSYTYLYYNGTWKIRTISSGVEIAGGTLQFEGTTALIEHDNGDNILYSAEGSYTRLYYDGTTKLQTDAFGILITGDCNISSGSSFQIDGTDLSYSDVGAASSSHIHNYINTQGTTALDGITADPRDFDYGVSCFFVSSTTNWQSYGSVLNIRGYGNVQDGSTLQIYAPYSPTLGGDRMQYRLGVYNNLGWTDWMTVADIDYCDDTYAYKTGSSSNNFYCANLYASSWVRIYNDYGIYFQTYGTGLRSPISDGGTYGSASTYGRENNWGGYSIEGRVVFMHNGVTYAGIYNDVDSEWMVRFDLGSAVRLYYDGAEKIRTSSDGLQTYQDTFYMRHANSEVIWGATLNSGMYLYYDNAYKFYTVSGGVYVVGDCSALTFTDRTPYPETTKLAYDAIQSMARLPDGEYEKENKEKQLDHSKLHSYLQSNNDDGNIYRDMSATISCLVEVNKDLIKRIERIEKQKWSSKK